MKKTSKFDGIKKFFTSGSWKLALIIFIMAALIAGIVVLNFVYRKDDGWDKLLYELMSDLLSAIVIGLFIGLITKIITQKLFSVQINMKKMRDLGIDGIGSGRFESSDVKKMFGGSYYRHKFPCVIKLMFLVGDVFLKVYENNFAECMNHGCEVQLLIARPTEDNREYLERIAERYNRGATDYIKKIKDDTLVTALKIKSASKNPDNLKIRFFKDEYQNNLRIAKYCKPNGEVTHYWINLQPISKAAKDLSIALKGTVVNDERRSPDGKEDENLCSVSEQGFDFLWNMYGKTEAVTAEEINKIRN